MTEKTYIEQRTGGGLYVVNTRISLDSIVYAFNRGESPQMIRQSFPTLTLEQVFGALTYYLANQQTVDEYLEKEEEEYDEFTEERRAAHPELYALFDSVRQAR